MAPDKDPALTITRDVLVRNKQGIHLRPASKIVKAMARFECEIYLHKGDRAANAKSIMSVTTLIAPRNTVLTIRAVGPDAEEATAALEALFVEKFGEE
ncbi:MAG: HPr family phosphocarrier protein [Deltaproteobacteria bacterium]|nr:HPr family phosphocarrier protein [Deltaproteobacteria bacterium]